MRVRMTGVLGDQEEFADLIGTNGDLSDDFKTYKPDHRGDWLSMEKTAVRGGGVEIHVETKLGNTFIFRIIPPQ